MSYLQKIKIFSKKNHKKKISSHDMFDNFLFISNLIKEFENFIFFGTLLGLVRDNKIIEGDDDIDFYVNINHRDSLIKKLKSNFLIIDESNPDNQNNSFLQVFRKFEDKIFVIDFYFYEPDKD